MHANNLHRIEFGPPKFFSKTFKFSIIFYSSLQISGGGHFRKACRSRKKESKPSEITCKHSEPARPISKIEKRKEFVRALWYEPCPKNSFKIFPKNSFTLLRGCWFWSKKLHFQKNFGRNSMAVEGTKSHIGQRKTRKPWEFLCTFELTALLLKNSTSASIITPNCLFQIFFDILFWNSFSTSVRGGFHILLHKPCHEEIHSALSSSTAPERVRNRFESGWK